MIFSGGLPLTFWGDAVHYAAYVLNRSPTNAYTDKVSPLPLLTKKAPTIGVIVSFGSPCTAFQDLKKKNFAERGQRRLIIGIGESTKGYHIYLQKKRVVVTTQHVKNIGSLNAEQNDQI